MPTGSVVHSVGQSIRVYYFVLRLFGFAPLPLASDSGQPTSTPRRTEAAESSAYTVFYVLLYSGIFAAYLAGESFTTEYESFLLSGAELTYCGLLFLNTLFGLLTGWIVRAKVRTLLQQLTAVDGDLRQVGTPVNHQRQYDAIWTGLYLNVVALSCLTQLTLVLVGLNGGEDNGEDGGLVGKLFYMMVFALATTVYAVEVLQGIVAVTLVVKRFEALG